MEIGENPNVHSFGLITPPFTDMMGMSLRCRTWIKLPGRPQLESFVPPHARIFAACLLQLQRASLARCGDVFRFRVIHHGAV